MRKWIHFPRQEGTCSRQAHADFPEQAIFEREIGRNGFFGPATHLHHTHAPTGWIDWQGPLRPRAFDLNLLQHKNVEMNGNSPWSAAEILFNAHCRYRMWHCHTAMQKLARNADGDELLFIHQGAGQLYCDYGHLSITQGDYVVIPRATLWRIEPDSDMQILMIEATNDSYQLPEKGLVGPHAIFDAGMLDVPAINQKFKAQYSEQRWQVEIKRHNQISEVTYPFNPLDAVGWHGDLSVVRINWRDIRPLMSHRYHLPPSAHTTFVASRFVICTFVPRPIESDPGALKVPFYHNNDDYDEVLFYHQGDFFSRDNIEKGMVTFHPAGFTHGPHPKAFAAGKAHKKTFTDEVAVMLDTRDALEVSEISSLVENPDYVNSWQVK
ncbi:homogentisate 1,2-dioxygenase [Aliiglaciecola sp. 2_MG-2023]|uniref:homogentisate 1,2-dioxygenase n=1 Tax=unclassified Aliiglaciecola TaxID=2593648 RepID=UPI0026E46F52|nr:MULTISPECIES: homogentisate 1,2-dioxygenase [unclassified Aliiglaciecola]MDO6709871.1 homogentisate 1,2-dioxygenase [Aliiglaciecola sp. 2_MG-2023]MDO6751019.1 homogentisate 1,2-dioxygenase [Aliiglaciecola sp. 1_MG-2023]